MTHIVETCREIKRWNRFAQPLTIKRVSNSGYVDVGEKNLGLEAVVLLYKGIDACPVQVSKADGMDMKVEGEIEADWIIRSMVGAQGRIHVPVRYIGYHCVVLLGTRAIKERLQHYIPPEARSDAHR